MNFKIASQAPNLNSTLLQPFLDLLHQTQKQNIDRIFHRSFLWFWKSLPVNTGFWQQFFSKALVAPAAFHIPHTVMEAPQFSQQIFRRVQALSAKMLLQTQFQLLETLYKWHSTPKNWKFRPVLLNYLPVIWWHTIIWRHRHVILIPLYSRPRSSQNHDKRKLLTYIVNWQPLLKCLSLKSDCLLEAWAVVSESMAYQRHCIY